MLHIATDANLDTLGAALMEELENVALIGELPIDEQSFHNLIGLLRGQATDSNYIYLDRIPSIVFIVSMVFCARYYEFIDDETPQ